MPRLSFVRPELSKVLPMYNKIRACLGGSEAVKAKRELYLPIPNASDKSKENKDRYNSYITRAIFYGFTGRTLAGLVGQVFERDPVSEIPDQLDPIEVDATGDGVSLRQSAEKSLAYTLAYARSGLRVDFPKTEGGLTVAQLEKGAVRPHVTTHDPFNVVNWRYRVVDGVKKLSMVNIAEEWPFFDDGFEIKTACQFVVMELNELNQYVVTTWRQSPGHETSWNNAMPLPSDSAYTLKDGPHVVTDFNGVPFDEILFKFIGVRNNDGSVDHPTMYDLAELNLGHYRNSADYEESIYRLGNPTYWFSGLTEDWIKGPMGGQVQIGSWGGVLLPVGGGAGILQMESNSSVKEAMEMKERQAVALGAKLVEQKSVQRTATEAKQDNASETSVLSSAANNVTAAYEWALKQCARFMGVEVSDQTLKWKLNSDFQMMQMSAADRLQLLKEWQSGVITFGEYRAVMTRLGIATEDQAVAAATIANEQAAAMEAAAKAAAMADPNPNSGAE